MKIITNSVFTGERALFFGKELKISDCVFENGESPLKESNDIVLKNCVFKWKYPVWYSKNVELYGCVFQPTARSGVWYTDNISFTDCKLLCPKTFRRASRIRLKNVVLPDAKETFWSCNGIEMDNVSAAGDYFGMNSQNVRADKLMLEGNYCFDGGKNIRIENSVLDSKDSFWNCENVTVVNSRIIGEYIGWNSVNVTFINCDIESLQGFCYMKNVKLVGCRLKNTTLAFEYSSVTADIDRCDSIKNPSSGVINVGDVGELILEPERVDITKTKINVLKK